MDAQNPLIYTVISAGVYAACGVDAHVCTGNRSRSQEPARFQTRWEVLLAGRWGRRAGVGVMTTHRLGAGRKRLPHASAHSSVTHGSKPGLSLTLSLPLDKQHKREKNIRGHLETLMAETRRQSWAVGQGEGAGVGARLPRSPGCRGTLPRHSLSGFTSHSSVPEVPHHAATGPRDTLGRKHPNRGRVLGKAGAPAASGSASLSSG